LTEQVILFSSIGGDQSLEAGIITLTSKAPFGIISVTQIGRT